MADPTVSPEQVRSARAWLKWSQSELARKAGVSQGAIAKYELERSVPYDSTLVRIRKAFEDSGIEFQFVGMLARGINITMR